VFIYDIQAGPKSMIRSGVFAGRREPGIEL